MAEDMAKVEDKRLQGKDQSKDLTFLPFILHKTVNSLSAAC